MRYDRSRIGLKIGIVLEVLPCLAVRNLVNYITTKGTIIFWTFILLWSLYLLIFQILMFCPFSPRAVIQGSCVITCASIRVHALIFESQKNLVKIVLVLFWIVDH